MNFENFIVHHCITI